ncbi:AP-5 complex subunit zeta-1-like [Mya arenaria]|uniref:AP-5 complex subunit zeta-1-like n=1 Tax=Mya arenaria TaxID=6604 RepID=UPI0022E12E58|nr:AP-5 complex subunit zeta-1-like [Mya arenaria]
MSLTLIDKLHSQARKATDEDVVKICTSLVSVFCLPEKSAETMALLRQLFFILQAKDSNTSLPSPLVIQMIQSVTSRDQGKLKECVLCQRILQELLPLDQKFDNDLGKIRDKIPSPWHLQMFKDTECIAKVYSKAIRWLKAQDLEFEIQRRLFTFLVGISLLHSPLLTQEKVLSVNDVLGGWLMNAGLYQAPNPYSSNPFRRNQNNLVTEVDGSTSNNFFTVLSIGQYYTDDQLVNIYSFSMLYQWIEHSYQALLDNDLVSTDNDPDIDSSEMDDELQQYRSQPQRIRSGSRSSLVSRSTAGGTASPSSTSSLEKQAIFRTSSAEVKQSPRSVTPSDLRKAYSLEQKDTLSESLSSVGSTGFAGRGSRVATPDSIEDDDEPSNSDIVTRDTTLNASEKREITQHGQTGSTPSKERAMTPVELLSPHDVGIDKGEGEEKRNVVKKAFGTLLGRTIDYCFRIIDQCDRKPKVQEDVELQNACRLETVKLLDLVCKIDPAQIPRTFRELKRLVTMVTSDDNNPKLLIVILRFLLNHSKAVAYDPQQELRTLFHRVLSRKFTSTAIAFDIIMFTLDNLESLTHDYNIMATYFPNLFKILAWNPHTYVGDFLDTVPAMMSLGTSLEVFHTIIDLPCMTVALYVEERSKSLDLTTMPSPSEEEPTSAIEAFKNALFRPMFNFFTRAEGGHGDTINRLDKFHSSIADLMEHSRVLVCYQAAPVLLRCWFSVILENVESDFVSALLSVLIERTGLIYGIPEYKQDVRRIITENLVLLLKKFPETVVRQRAEIGDFLSNTSNILGREAFFNQLVWAVGEFLSTAYSPDCSAEVVGQMYETLELLTYEVIGVTGSTPAASAPYSVQVVSYLMSTLAKLASRCQDLIPRAILCLTKVARQHRSDVVATEDQEILFTKAQELINLLKMPNFASVILNPPPTLETDRVHEDNSSLATLLRFTHRLVAPTV